MVWTALTARPTTMSNLPTDLTGTTMGDPSGASGPSTVPGGTNHPYSLTPAEPPMPAQAKTHSNVSTAAADKPVFDTNHKVHDPKQPGSGGGLLSKLKPSSSLKTSQPAPTSNVYPTPSSTVQNLPTGPGIDYVPLVPGGKDTRFSDVVHVAPPSGHAEDNVVTPAGSGGLVTPGGGGGGSMVVAADSKGHNKLKKKPEGAHVVTTPGAPPPGSVLGDLGDGTTTVPPPARPGSTTPSAPGATVLPGAFGSAGGVPGKGTVVSQPKAADIPILEEIVLPDGSRAYIRKGTAPAPTAAPSVLAPPPAAISAGPSTAAAPATLSKKDKQKEQIDAMAAPNTGGHTHTSTESQMGMGHCAMCCPSGPKDASGRPIYPCAHQNGLSGPSAMDRAQVAHAGDPANPAAPAAGGKKKPAPSAAPLPDLPGGNETVVVQENVQPSLDTGNAGGGKLKKGKGPAALSNEEEAMEDARKLAGELIGRV